LVSESSHLARGAGAATRWQLCGTLPPMRLLAISLCLAGILACDSGPGSTATAGGAGAGGAGDSAEPMVPPDVAAVPADAEVTASGLASRELQPGTGSERPTAASVVTVHYSGWTTDGVLFDSSVVRGEPASFPLDAVIPGWTEGLQLMVVGERRRFWIPAELAYGEMPQGGRPAGMLVFDVELLGID
jgi:hypothetical protein